MSLNERRANLIQQINTISNEETLEMLEESLAFYNHSDSKDITDGLSAFQLKELEDSMKESADKDTISHEEFKNLFSRWNTK